MIPLASLLDVVSDYGPIIGLLGVASTLGINGMRDERQRRRDTHARAIEAVVAYSEMPYRIRRRRHEPDQRSAERARLSDALSVAQAELASCEAMIRGDRDVTVRDAYERLVATLRECAGQESARAWNEDPISDDKKMGLATVHNALAPVRGEQERCEAAMAASTRTWI